MNKILHSNMCSLKGNVAVILSMEVRIVSVTSCNCFSVTNLKNSFETVFFVDRKNYLKTVFFLISKQNESLDKNLPDF